MMTRYRTFVRDDGETELEVEYTISGGSEPSGLFGPPEDYDPGSAAEVVVTGAWLVADADKQDAPRVQLTEAEYERFEIEVNQDPATWEVDDDYWD